MPYIPQDRRADVLAEMREHGTHWTPKMPVISTLLSPVSSTTSFSRTVAAMPI